MLIKLFSNSSQHLENYYLSTVSLLQYLCGLWCVCRRRRSFSLLCLVSISVSRRAYAIMLFVSPAIFSFFLFLPTQQQQKQKQQQQRRNSNSNSNIVVGSFVVGGASYPLARFIMALSSLLWCVVAAAAGAHVAGAVLLGLPMLLLLLLLHATRRRRLQGVCGARFALAHSLCVCELEAKTSFLGLRSSASASTSCFNAHLSSPEAEHEREHLLLSAPF